MIRKEKEMNSILKIGTLTVGKKIAIGVLLAGLLGCIAFLFSDIQNGFIYFVETSLNRKLNNPRHYQIMLKELSFTGIISCIILLPIVIFIPSPAKIENCLNRAAKKRIGGITIKEIILNQPFVLISFVFILYLLKNIFLLINMVNLNTVIFVLAVLSHTIIVFFFYRKRKENGIVHILTGYLLIIISLLINSLIYDHSYDGQAYHQVGALELSKGWNPLYSALPDDEFIWVNHYPKFTEMYGSLFLSVFKNIESGKSYNMVFFLIVFFYALKYTSKYHKNKLAVLAISMLFAANPVVLAQFFTYYVDGILGMLIIILIFACMDYEQEKSHKPMCIIIAVSVFAINTKMTGFICGFVLAAYSIKGLCEKKYKQMFTLMLSGILALIIGVLCTGYNPYMTNLLNFGHPFYPLYGENTIDIISNQIDGITSVDFTAMHPVQRFFSLFFLDYNLKTVPFNPLKIIKLSTHRVFDLRIGGFGQFFIEIAVLTGLILYGTIKNKKTTGFRKLLFSVCLLLAITIIMPENWWARYISFFWYVFGLLSIASNYRININKKLFLVLCIIVGINSGTFFVGNAINGIIYTKSFKHFVSDIKKIDNETIYIIVDREVFKYSIEEKLRYHHVNKDIIYIEDYDAPFTNGVLSGHIKGWH